MTANILLLSIKPKYASKIFTGAKTVELRRVRTRLNTGDLVLVYVPSPEKALMGSFEVESISVIKLEEFSQNLENFWDQVKDKAGISSEDFRNYYAGASVGVGIFLKNAKQFPAPIALDILREKMPQFKPPQCYRYIKAQEMDILTPLMEDRHTIATKALVI